MLGSAKNRSLNKLFSVSLEALVPANTFHRNREATLDLSFVPEWTRDLYAEGGILGSIWSCSSRGFAPSASPSNWPA
jgi:hypothetical protein